MIDRQPGLSALLKGDLSIQWTRSYQRIGGIRCCRTFVPYVLQERPEHYERRQVGVGLDCQTHLGAGRPIKHPRWNLQPTVRVGCSQVAAKDNTAWPLNCLMNADSQAGPWMPRIQQLPKFGVVGVLKPCCTTAIGLIRALTDARPIKPTSTRCLSARRPNPGRGSTYRRGNSVQTTAATSLRKHGEHLSL
jgi:hypothetical protein